MQHKRVTIDEARTLSHAGAHVANPRAGKRTPSGEREPSTIFAASHAIHWRPDPTIPEPRQYAVAIPIS